MEYNADIFNNYCKATKNNKAITKPLNLYFDFPDHIAF